MIRINWKLIKEGAKNNPGKIIDYLKNVYVLKGTMYDYLSRNKWAKKVYSETKGVGEPNFIIDVDSFILNDLNATEMEQFVCLDLMAKRDMFTYLNTKGRVNFVPTWKVKNLYDIEKLKTNRLLMIEDNNIYFVTEGE